MRTFLSFCVVLATSALSFSVSAQQTPAPAETSTPTTESVPAAEPAPESTAGKKRLSIGVGLKGGLNGSLVSGVPENEPIDGTGRIDPNIYPMFGLGGGVGLLVEARYEGFIGFETGFHISFDNGSGFEDINDPAGNNLLRRNQDQSTTAYHIPLLLKFIVPGELVQPVFGLGLEIVVQSSSELEFDPENVYPDRYEIETDTYALLAATLGLEFNVGVVRIPLELRLGYNVGFSNNASDRVDYDGSTLTYFGAYQGHFGLFTGIAYDYDLFL